ncbi:glycoside hydrolase family 130 protein [Sphingomonas sp. PAMC 26621]|uniref:glycoside hydrolase family 130 protein n=1 Tax=Sphingomonas sp. PAMC 26621 TaxID=1112213 RepID=UPI0002EEAB9C|nr:glycoside hydrolase family 130 protein [Sphingomonas sp. PAMC 26621]
MRLSQLGSLLFGRPSLGSTMLLHHHGAMLKPDPSRTVIRPFEPGYPSGYDNGSSRLQVIAERVLTFNEGQVGRLLSEVSSGLKDRHRDVDATFRRRFEDLRPMLVDIDSVDAPRRELIGALFMEEYAFEAAALFNPSAVLHPDQQDVPPGCLRFVMSLRGIGEGHVSSVSFRTGIWTIGGGVEIDPVGPITQPPVIDAAAVRAEMPHLKLNCGGSHVISETVLFPVLPTQRQGIEDVRLVRFVEGNGEVTYYGTYTAFDGMQARSEMLVGTDFRSWEMRKLTGDAVGAKGMALFPRRINDRYFMLGRQDNESIWLLSSDDLFTWNAGAKLIEPRFPWEAVQMGNCGSPVEIDEGWLVLTHGVGAVRNYSIGACLLDRDDPSRVIARTPEPILSPSPEERDGYVPNVVYSCGAVVHGRELLIPYGVADSFTAFATARVDDLLAAMV